MGLDEALFSAFWRFWQRRKTDPTGSAALLEAHKTRLVFLARAATGLPMVIQEAEDAGGAEGRFLYLPRSLAFFPDSAQNERLYLFRTLFSCAALELSLTLPAESATGPVERWLLSLLLAPRILSHLSEAWPAWRPLCDPLPALQTLEQTAQGSASIDRVWLCAALSGLPIGPTGLCADLPQALSALPALWAQRQQKTPSKQNSVLPTESLVLGLLRPAVSAAKPQPVSKSQRPSDRTSFPTGTELKKQVREKLRKRTFRDDEQQENPLSHAFEKVLTADDYRGGQKPVDGDDELQDHAAALSELDLRDVIVSHKQTQSIFRADVQIQTDAEAWAAPSPTEDQALLYDEWDEARRAYKTGFCRVTVCRVEDKTPNVQQFLTTTRAAQRQQTNWLKKRLWALRNQRKWQNRELDGPELDLPAVIDRHANLRAGHTPPDRLYMIQRLAHRDVATLILLDGSMSMDSWVENFRVLDVAEQAIVLLGDVLGSFGDPVAVAAFSSNTHADCRFLPVKGFSEPFSVAYRRLLSLSPSGYTRLGPALRHAQTVLLQTTARKRLLLVITDGKPTDYDRYEGTYGVADCRQAVREARRQGLFVRMLAIDGKNKAHLAEMMGQGHYQVLVHPQKLATALVHLYTQLVG